MLRGRAGDSVKIPFTALQFDGRRSAGGRPMPI